MSISVTKRDGSKEPLDIDKIHKVVEWACEGRSNVSVSEIELRSHIQFYNNIKSKDIHETLIKATADLISEAAPDYQYVAGALVNYHLRKEVYGHYDPDHLHAHYKRILTKGVYDKNLAEAYSDAEWEELNGYIDHERDYTLTYTAMEQMRGKYLVKNRSTKKFHETPQMAFMLIAMSLFHKYDKSIRMQWVKDLYDALSKFDISLPTPIMAGVRTPDRQFSSCTLIETADNLDSIIATTGAVVKYVSQKAGIGLGAGALRALGSPVRNGAATTTGVVPFFKLLQSATSSCSQGSIRSGKATLHYPLWHLEFEELIVLKNNAGIEDNRIRQLDYSVQFNKVMYERLLSGGNITFFSPSDVPGLYDAFYNDVDLFRELYEKYERTNKIRKKTMPAVEVFRMFMKERKDTGRIYLQNVDHCNDHGSFRKDVAPIRMSNLCQEITLPTKPLMDLNDPDGEIALCILAAVNWGKIKKPSDFEKPCTLVVRALDALIDFQAYPVAAAKNATLKRRPIGVGVINLAYWLAKNNTNYSNPDLALVHEFAEAWSYYLINASADLAIEFGACPASGETLYHDGMLPIDTYKKDVDELTVPVYYKNWDALRGKLQTYGIRNSTLMALMPSETSSQISNSTNGIEPPRALVSIKQSKDGVPPQVVPEIGNRKVKYELLWDQESPRGYLSIVAVLQKFIDQSISTNTSYNPKFFPEEEIPLSVLLGDLLFAYKHGVKTLYYFNTNDQSSDSEDDEDCEACKI